MSDDIIAWLADELGVTEDEVGQMTWPDLQAARTLFRARIDQEQAWLRDLNEMRELGNQYSPQPGEPLDDLAERMSVEDAARFRELGNRAAP